MRVSSIRTLVAAKQTELNKQIITCIVREHKSKFLATDFIFNDFSWLGCQFLRKYETIRYISERYLGVIAAGQPVWEVGMRRIFRVKHLFDKGFEIPVLRPVSGIGKGFKMLKFDLYAPLLNPFTPGYRA